MERQMLNNKHLTASLESADRYCRKTKQSTRTMLPEDIGNQSGKKKDSRQTEEKVGRLYVLVIGTQHGQE